MTWTASKRQADIRDNMTEFYKTIGQANPELEFVDDGILSRYKIPIPHPFLNRVLRTKSAFHEDASANVQETLALYKEHSLPCLWMEWAMEEQPSLSIELEQHGFRKVDSMPGMALEFSDWQDEDIPISGFEMRPVQSAAEFDITIGILQGSFGFPEVVARAFARFVANAGFDETAPIKHYLGWLDDRPVSTITAFRHGGVTGIYNVATTEAVRGRGIGYATTAYALRQERDAGSEAAILHSSKLGYSVYRRIGFQDALSVDLYLNM